MLRTELARLEAKLAIEEERREHQEFSSARNARAHDKIRGKLIDRIDALIIAIGEGDSGDITMPRKKNPSEQTLEEAKDVYQGFHHGEPEITQIKVESLTIPDTLIVIGKVVAIEYEPTGGSSRKGEVYRHEWGDTGKRKLDTLHYFCTDTTRREFYLIKGKIEQSYPVFNERGVVG